MKILVLTSSFPRYPGDYQGNFIYHLARGQVELGNSVLVLSPHIPGTPFSETMNGIEVIRSPYFFPYDLERLSSDTGMYSALQHSLLAWFQVPLFFFCQLSAAYRLISRRKIDIIHAHWIVPQGLIGAHFHRFSGIPHIVSIHGTDLNLAKKSRLLRALCRFIIRNSAIITVNSSFMQSQLLGAFPEAGPKVRIIPMGVDLSRFAQEDSSDSSAERPSDRIILSAGRLIDWKGTEYLIEAMPDVVSRFPDARLVIIGSGPREEYLRVKVRDLHMENHIEFTGTVSGEVLKGYIRSAGVFVLPSVDIAGLTEGLGVVLLEAMASGIPVIGSRVGGIPDIIRDGENGFLVPGRDSRAIAEKIVVLFSNPDLADRFRQEGLRTVRSRFSWDEISCRFSETYDQLMEVTAA